MLSVLVSSLLSAGVTSLPQYWIQPLHYPYLYFLPLLTRIQTPPEDILTASGLQIEILRTTVHCRKRIEAGDLLTVHYTGSLASTGQQFDSSQPGDPISFVIGEGKLIKGWEEGLLNRCQGDEVRLTIPPHLAYGEEGRRQAGEGGEEEISEEYIIPPGSTLIFDLQVVKVE